MKKTTALTLCLVLACLFAISGGFSRALTKEAAANDRHLFVDTAPHFINKVYQPAEGN